ncbi:MAG TPA: iron-containing alcohol dehydrogenase family protein [Limnochordia bacterium]|nr:iron-containing alcohol dehydrogenase family protein [Bacillota bacterium]HOB09200.1 iron-containing alcohol dehydrogenase family protein [Limnochordia bacterium]NLH31718.1 iron-containing alcohol dehydrogenase [Bacillota bacterium]HPT93912.1 iron-containing alcohol dehydrogenase family protein [Limnochordia bacterium]HPZ30088.1 iron-containing alcohol dehydrogenase family protein [Limnochordia bacterium]
MLDFSFFMPTEILHGPEVVKRHAKRLKEFGRKALLVTGRNSARRSGAQEDVTAALEHCGIAYEVFDQVENNPTLENIAEGGRAARQFAPDFVIGIGGGSPLDAAKAIAVLAVNSFGPEKLYDGDYTNRPLPVVAVPTTAGTGSEVTQYSILTLTNKQTKAGFGDRSLFPRLAFLDYRYTESLELEVTRNTAVDALSHLIEAYLSRRAGDFSDILVEAGLRLWSRALPDLKSAAFSSGMRDSLLAASTFGGMAIAHTGTTVVHALGYPLTYFHDIPHGRANGLLLAEYLRYNLQHAKSRVGKILKTLNLKDIGEFKELMRFLLPCDLRLTAEQISEYGIAASRTKNASHTLGEVSSQTCIDILQSSLG